MTILGWQLFSDKGFYYVLLVFAVLTVVAVECIRRGRMGRLLMGLSDSAVALETHGATTNVMKVLVFCITAGLAAIAGALLASLYDYGLGTNYSSFSSLTMVAIVVVIVMGDPWYAIVAGITFGVIPSYINVSQHLLLRVDALRALGGHVRGAGATASLRCPWVVRQSHRPLGWPSTRDRPGGGRARRAGVGRGGGREAERPGRSRDGPPRGGGVPDKAGLAVRELSVQFGGVRAVDDVSLDAPMARDHWGWSGRTGPARRRPSTPARVCSSRPQERFSCTIAT